MQPVMLRIYQGGNKGATAFFRNRPLLETLMDALEATGQRRVTLFVHAASVGAEPYSLALYHRHRKAQAFELAIQATDINASFLEIAHRGSYPAEVARGLTPEELTWFLPRDGALHVPDEAKAMVRFLPPMDFVRQKPEGEFDAVMIMNALTYVTPAEQHAAIQQAAACARSLLALTAFHPDSIRADIEAAGFEPLMTRHEAIHQAWGDRLATAPIDPGSAEYSWKLPPYDTRVPDHPWRFGAIFRRRGA
jgi:chemotaxis methyl-accepting protein methylase